MSETDHTADSTEAESTNEATEGIDRSDLPQAANDPPTDEEGSLDEDAIAVRPDFEHKRGGDGEILPIWEPLPGGEKHVCVTPITQGEAEEWLPKDGNILMLEGDQIAAVLAEFYEWPDFSDLRPKHVDEHRRGERSDDNPFEDFGAFGVDPLLMALANASNFDVMKGMLADNADMVRAVEEIEGNTKTGN